MTERSTRWIALASVLLLSACIGRLGSVGPTEDAGTQVTSDDSGIQVMFDDGGPGVDAGPTALDGGPPPAPDAGPIDPCAGVSCGAGASCVAGTCRCNPGFIEMGGACIAPLPGDPAGRTQAAVCDAWRMGHVENASPAWTGGSDTCDAGTMAPAAIDDTLRRVNMFRWLAGLGPVEYNGANHQQMMECAHMMSVNGALSHSPPTGWTCYTSGGAGAAGRSNIALGYSSSGSAIDGYMDDSGTPSLGHRRWILSGRLGSVEIGFSSAARPGQCLGVFDSSGTTDRPWTAYPNQGFAPIDMAAHTWSFHVNSISLNSGASVEVQRVSDGAPLAVEHYYIEGYGPPTSIGFTPSGWTPVAGETYRVTIHGTSAGDVTYDVTLVSC